MNNFPFIKNQRQKRAIEVLLNCSSISVKNIGPLIGALNPRQTIFELRSQGFSNIILTSRRKIKDREGQTCYPGAYLIPEELKSRARKALEKFTTSANEVAKVAKTLTQNHNTRGV